MTLCNMVIEAGGKNGVIPPDSTTHKYLEVRRTHHLSLSLSHACYCQQGEFFPSFSLYAFCATIFLAKSYFLCTG